MRRAPRGDWELKTELSLLCPLLSATDAPCVHTVPRAHMLSVLHTQHTRVGVCVRVENIESLMLTSTNYYHSVMRPPTRRRRRSPAHGRRSTQRMRRTSTGRATGRALHFVSGCVGGWVAGWVVVDSALYSHRIRQKSCLPWLDTLGLECMYVCMQYMYVCSWLDIMHRSSTQDGPMLN